MAKNNLLFELGFEELPVEANALLRDRIKEMAESFPSEFRDEEFRAGVFSTPRRIAVFLENIRLSSETKDEEVKGPAESIIFAGDSLTKAGEGFVRSKQISKENLIRKDGFVYYAKRSGGEKVEDAFSQSFKKCLASISFDKTMKWEKSGFLFPRPIRWVMGFVNNSPVNFEIAGVSSDTYTYGNRSVNSSRIPVFNGYDYFEKTGENYVEVDREKRKAMILSEIEKTVSKMSLSLIKDEALLEEVADLVEYPVIFCGKFDERFLNLPPEIIVAALKQHQRYFSLLKSDNTLSPYFVFVSNAPYADTDDIVNNNQRIISSRLEDAEFYYRNDLSRDIKYYEDVLKKTIFHEQLGTFFDKTERNRKLAEKVLMMMGAKAENLPLLSLLCKFDVATEMIKDGKEFTKLQGVIGSHYAEKMGYSKEDASVSREHYLPLTNDGELPSGVAGTAFAVADKTDNICGAFVSGNKPTGSKDPMSVRRDSLSLIYLLIKKNLKIDLSALIREGLAQYGRDDLAGEVLDYLRNRFEVLFSTYSISYDATRCAIYGEKLLPLDIMKKAKLLMEMKKNDDFADIVGGLKRVSNILKSEKEGSADTEFSDPNEKLLYESGKAVDEANVRLLSAEDYEGVLSNLLSLRKPIDAFFDKVMVMDNDMKVRNRRIQLLFFIRRVFLKFGDFSQIVFDSDCRENIK